MTDSTLGIWSGRSDSNARPLEPHSYLGERAPVTERGEPLNSGTHRDENSGANSGTTTWLGPVPCQLCRQPVTYNGHAWISDGLPHRCPRYMDDPELGRMRRCIPCGEYWPFDSEFWKRDGSRNWRCRACRTDTERRSRKAAA